jgi:hypothetical protein
MRWRDDFHSEVDDFHPEVGYLLPSRGFRRTLRMAAFAGAIGVVVGAGGTALLMKPRAPVELRPPDAAQFVETAGRDPETARPYVSRAWARFHNQCRAGEANPIVGEESVQPDLAALPHPSYPPASAIRETAAEKTASPKRPKIVDATKLKPLREFHYGAGDAYATPFWADANRPSRNRFHSEP